MRAGVMRAIVRVYRRPGNPSITKGGLNRGSFSIIFIVVPALPYG